MEIFRLDKHFSTTSKELIMFFFFFLFKKQKSGRFIFTKYKVFRISRKDEIAGVRQKGNVTCFGHKIELSRSYVSVAPPISSLRKLNRLERRSNVTIMRIFSFSSLCAATWSRMRDEYAKKKKKKKSFSSEITTELCATFTYI